MVRARRMVRNFEDRAVPREVVDELIDLARRAPSAGFTQGTELLVLEGVAQTDHFWAATFPPQERNEFAWPGLFRAPVIVVPFANKTAYLDRYAEPDKGWADRDESRWPVPYWEIDAGFATMTLLLAATDAGLGAAFFGLFRGVEALQAEFGVPEEMTPIGAVALGYPAQDRLSGSLRRGRRPFSEIVHREKW